MRPAMPSQPYARRTIDQPRLAQDYYFRQHPFHVGFAHQDREAELALLHEPCHDRRVFIHTEADGLDIGTVLQLHRASASTAVSASMGRTTWPKGTRK